MNIDAMITAAKERGRIQIDLAGLSATRDLEVRAYKALFALGLASPEQLRLATQFAHARHAFITAHLTVALPVAQGLARAFKAFSVSMARIQPSSRSVH